MISPWNGFDIRKMIPKAITNEMATPNLEWLSFMSYGSLNIPAKILPAAIPEVIVEAIPENKRATANTTAA